MYRDPSEFRERFKAYKDGKSVREIYGLPGYSGGKFDAATKKKIDYYYKLLRNNGFDMMSAVGILGNMMQESSFNPNVVNHLGYHGLLQNSKEIQQAIKSQYGDLSEQSQLRYLSDWTDGSTWIRKGPYAKDTALYSKSYLRSGYKTPEQAAYEFLKRYERAIVVDKKTNAPLRDANGNYIYQDKDKRLGYAKSIYNYLSGQPDGIQEQITQVGKTQPEPIIATQDATRVATIPTIQQQAIDYSDRRNAVAAETQRAIWAHDVMKDMKGAYQVPIWESPSLPALTPVEYDVTPLKTYAGGKLPGYQNGLTPQQIENIIVQNQGTIQQGHRWSPLSSYANSTWRDYNKPFFQQFIEGGLGNAARGLQQQFESWNKEVRGIADITDHANVLLDILTGVGGKITKDSSKELIKNTKKAVKKVMQPTKASVKKEIKTLPELVEHHKQHPEELKPLKSKVYDDIQEQVYKQSNYKQQKTGGKPLEFVKDEAYTAEFPNTVKTTAYHSPNGSVFDRVATENTNKFKIMGPHEYHHLLEEQIKYTPQQASILEQAFPLSEEFKKAHPNFNYLRERAAMNAELAYAIGNKYGFPVGPEFDNVVRNMSPWELEEIASSLSAYNKDSSVQRMFGGIDLLPKIPLKDALMRVPAGIGLYAGIQNEYKNGKLPQYEDGKKPSSKRARAMYNAIDPRGEIPSKTDAIKNEAHVRRKMYFGDPDEMEYQVGETVADKVSDAAWRKRLGYDYDKTLLIPNGNAVRLPKELEQEIPTDTTMLKNRIEATKKLMKYSSKYKYNKYVRLAKQVDEEALEALRKTYKTGQPVSVNEHSFNSRQWVSGGEVTPTMSPLNVLQNYTIQYDPQNNRMLYSDIYDFNEYDWAIPGQPYDIKGYVDLPKYKNGKIYIKPANRGKFNATKKRTGKTTEELTHSKNPLTRKRAIFAQNARKWNHK